MKMERYDYESEIRDSISDYLDENVDFAEVLKESNYDVNRATEELIEKLNDDLFVEDSVTGNASGSYFFSTWKAEEAIAHNWDLIADVIEEWDCPDILRKGPEAIDVSIRCYLLSQVLWGMEDDIKEMFRKCLSEVA